MRCFIPQLPQTIVSDVRKSRTSFDGRFFQPAVAHLSRPKITHFFEQVFQRCIEAQAVKKETTQELGGCLTCDGQPFEEGPHTS